MPRGGGGARRIRIRIFRHWTCLAGRTHRQNISFPLINPWETCDSLCLSLIHFFQLSATAEPPRAAPDGNRALFSSPKREMLPSLDDVTCWRNFAVFSSTTSSRMGARGSFPGVKLPTLLKLVPRSRKHGSVLPLTPQCLYGVVNFTCFITVTVSA
jgi:hypothetical protein